MLVEFEEPIGLAFIDLAEELEDLLGVKVDLVSKNGVKERYLDEIKRGFGSCLSENRNC